MQLDALTAGTTLILVQLCVSFVMAGIFFAVPSEKCTRHWALSAICVAVGLTLVVLNAGAPRYLILIAGNNLLLAGIIYQWCGLRAFYNKKPGLIGWIIGALFFVLYGMSLIMGASVAVRGLLSALAISAMFILFMYEVISGQAGRRSFGSVLAMSAIGIMLIAYSVRLVLAIFQLAEMRPQTNTLLSISLLYLVPIVGALMLSNALVLLYFERIVADKHHLATHDELTKVLNRRAIVSCGTREVAVARRTRKALAVGFVDIDHFKQINDKFGHPAGDSVLCEVAELLKKTCRNIDSVGRYGGEEFCIVFPGMDMAACEIVGERLVSAVGEHRFSSVPSVTISIGIALLRTDDASVDWHTLVHVADRELYRAKHAGRNRISIAGATVKATYELPPAVET